MEDNKREVTERIFDERMNEVKEYLFGGKEVEGSVKLTSQLGIIIGAIVEANKIPHNELEKFVNEYCKYLKEVVETSLKSYNASKN